MSYIKVGLFFILALSLFLSGRQLHLPDATDVSAAPAPGPGRAKHSRDTRYLPPRD